LLVSPPKEDYIDHKVDQQASACCLENDQRKNADRMPRAAWRAIYWHGMLQATGAP